MADESKYDPGKVNLYARDRAAHVTVAVLAVVKDALCDIELRARIAAYLRQEFNDVEQQVISENRTDI
jgi:hypothetical protein